jgi:hypothetical protein
MPNFFPGEDFPRSFDEHRKKTEGQILDPDTGTIPGQLVLSDVELEWAKAVSNPSWRQPRHALPPRVRNGSTAEEEHIHG